MSDATEGALRRNLTLLVAVIGWGVAAGALGTLHNSWSLCQDPPPVPSWCDGPPEAHAPSTDVGWFLLCRPTDGRRASAVLLTSRQCGPWIEVASLPE